MREPVSYYIWSKGEPQIPHIEVNKEGWSKLTNRRDWQNRSISRGTEVHSTGHNLHFYGKELFALLSVLITSLPLWKGLTRITLFSQEPYYRQQIQISSNRRICTAQGPETWGLICHSSPGRAAQVIHCLQESNHHSGICKTPLARKPKVCSWWEVCCSHKHILDMWPELIFETHLRLHQN